VGEQCLVRWFGQCDLRSVTVQLSPVSKMIEIPMAEFRGRVLLSRERVKFAEADPYGHLASGAYVNMIMSHRVEALDDLAGFSILSYARAGIAFPARNIEITYFRPAFVGEMLELASWIEALGTSSFEVRVVVAGLEDRIARAAAKIHFVAVDTRSGAPVPVPATLPSSANADPLRDLPQLSGYYGAVRGLPEGWSALALEPA
jgi:acyl-CoA thioester hydrolase